MCFICVLDRDVMLSSRNNTLEKVVVDSVPGCHNKISSADILAMATRDVIELVNKKFPLQ